MSETPNQRRAENNFISVPPSLKTVNTHSSTNSSFNLPLFSSTLHTVQNNSIAYIRTGVRDKLESVILSGFHYFDSTSAVSVIESESGDVVLLEIGRNFSW